MKKPLLATAGVVGACAACCAIPLAAPLLGGMSAAGFIAADWNVVPFAKEAAAALAVGGLVAAAAWWHRRRRAARPCAAPASSGSGCGCATRKEV